MLTLFDMCWIVRCRPYDIIVESDFLENATFSMNWYILSGRPDDKHFL